MRIDLFAGMRRLSIFLVLMLSACSLLPSHQHATLFPLIAPSALGTQHSTLQLIQAHFNAHDFAFQCAVDADTERLTLIGLSAEGQRLFRLGYDGRTLQSSSAPQLTDQLDPRRVLADLQLALWPLSALQQAIMGTAWRVTEPTTGTRRLVRDGRLIAEVHYASADAWRGRLWLSNFEYGYSLAIESQDLP